MRLPCHIALLGLKMMHIGIRWLSKLIAAICFRRHPSLGQNAQRSLYFLDKSPIADGDAPGPLVISAVYVSQKLGSPALMILPDLLVIAGAQQFHDSFA